MKSKRLLSVWLISAICAASLSGCAEKSEVPLESTNESSAASAWMSITPNDIFIPGTLTESSSPTNPTPENPSPENPSPENPSPENPSPENPSPTNPTPANPSPTNPTPANPSPTNPTPVNPSPTYPTPVNPTPASSSSTNSWGTSSSTTSSSTTSSSTTSSSTTSSSTTSSSTTSSSTTSSSSKPNGHQHTYTTKTVAPTCAEVGYTLHTCSCGDQYTTNTVGALGHDCSGSVVKPTCTASGYTQYTCKRCNYNYKDNFTSATGHKWGEWIVTKNPTSSSTGQKRRECTICRKTEFETIPKTTGDTSAYASELLRLVNEERTKNGLGKLTTNSKLTQYANTRSKELVNGYLDNPQEYIRTVLMKSDGVTYAGENYGGGYPTPAAVMTAWMGNTSYKNRILNSNYKYIGVSCYQSGKMLYWVVDFAG